MNASGLQEALHGLSSEAVDVATPEGTAEGRWQPEGERMPELASPAISRPLQDNWRVTSYTGLQQHGPSVALDLTPRFDIDAAGETAEVATPALTPHTFPRGASPGTFLHGLFETLDFSQPPDEAWLAEQLQLAGFGDQWLPMLVDWLSRVLQTPLHQNGVSLAQLMPGQYLVELEFYLPMHQLLTAPALDAVMRRHDPLSARAPELNFQQVQGMLKGFIDLVFCWQGKYYLLDYKSNWLGEESSAYTPQAMAEAMIGHRYDLQYQLYTLALHRYLRHRVADYDYERHFGGVFYLFLRGMDGSASENGVFHHRPSIDFVRALDSLFTGDQVESK
ncbi:MAG: exodeoxyribonuclease V subunit beta, partial [Mixta calida]|nr:exodeoxyribonuclease V subunit beta [Mixta calida]